MRGEPYTLVYRVDYSGFLVCLSLSLLSLSLSLSVSLSLCLCLQRC